MAAYLKKAQLTESVLYIVTTLGVPLKVDGPGMGPRSEHASVDSELALLYGKLRGTKYSRSGPLPNPMYQRDARLQHPAVPIYVVTRLAAYDFNDVKAMIDRSLAARNRGKFVLDLQSEKTTPATTGCAPRPCCCPWIARRSTKPPACCTTRRT